MERETKFDLATVHGLGIDGAGAVLGVPALIITALGGDIVTGAGRAPDRRR